MNPAFKKSLLAKKHRRVMLSFEKLKSSEASDCQIPIPEDLSYIAAVHFERFTSLSPVFKILQNLSHAYFTMSVAVRLSSPWLRSSSRSWF